MPKFVIDWEIPGAENLTQEQLQLFHKHHVVFKIQWNRRYNEYAAM